MQICPHCNGIHEDSPYVEPAEEVDDSAEAVSEAAVEIARINARRDIRVAELDAERDARIAALEAEVAALRTPPPPADPVIIEVPAPETAADEVVDEVEFDDEGGIVTPGEDVEEPATPERETKPPKRKSAWWN